MKKKFAFFFVFLFAFVFISCKDKKNGSNVASSENQSAASEIQGTKIEFAGFDKLFKLDYTPEVPEEEMIPEKIGTDYSAASGKSESFIPGLRSLDKYKTEYKTKRLSIADYLKSIIGKETTSEVKFADGSTASEENEKKSSPGEFKVVSWGPSGEVPGELEKPEFFVKFSLPLKPLSALDDQAKINAEGAEIMKIEPSISGNYKWLGTDKLAFIATQSLDPTQIYKINVNNALMSESGVAISGNTSFSTKSSELKFVSLQGGVKESGGFPNNTSSGFSTEDARFAYIQTNYYMTEDEMRSVLSISMNRELDLSYKLKGDFSKKRVKTRVSNDSKKTTGFFVEITNSLANEKNIYYTIVAPNSGKKLTKSYSTVRSLKLVEYSPNTSWYGFEYTFKFNNDILARSAEKSFYSPDIDITKNNVFVNWNTVRIRNLPIKPGQRITICMRGDIEDVYGSKLGADQQFTAVGTDYNGNFSLIDSGCKIMESQFPHKILFEYMNANDSSYYLIGKTDKPLDPSIMGEGSGEKRMLDVSNKNVRMFQEVDLDPFLTNGKGAVHFESQVFTRSYNYNGEASWTKNCETLNVQVTDLAATARLGANKAVILVRSLSTGNPVKDAVVSIENSSIKNVSQTVKTDANGCAVIPYNPLDFFLTYEDSYKNVFVRIKTDDDEVVFVPSTHNPWNSNVYPSSMFASYATEQRTFIFCDRGLYKPGETITFKGIDKTQSFGSFSSYNGSYSIVFEKYNWQNPTVYGTITGNTSESGGFHGSFDIPSDLEPGEYRLNYKRTADDKHTDSRTLYFTVAYFEPLKIQSELSMTSKDIIAGDSISADLKASYLAGGALADAAYEATWYSSGTRFAPDNVALKDYSFGISDDYDSRKVVSEESGTLSSSGKTSLSCSTQGSYKPIPYEFRLETYVTDESNQTISASARKIVHPAEFYIGIGEPVDQKGFAKKGKAMELPFVLVAPDGTILKDSDLPKSMLSSSFKYTLTRRYWTYDYQKSVGGGVYAQYKENKDVELTSSVNLAADGKIKITPNSAGYYTMRVEGKDSKGRPVVTDYSFYVTGSGAVWGGDESSINLTCDASMYNPGDTAYILMESPLAAGDYLITVEREGIFTEEVRHIDEPTTVLDVKIARNYVPVVYVSVSTYSERKGEPTHQYGEVDLNKPKGIYGVTPVFINPRVKAFSVKVETDKKIYRPGDMATVTLTATKGGKPVEGAELTAMACDRAVLDLIDYHVPDPIEFFYDRYNFPLYCYGGDSRDYLMDPVTYSIKNLQGGDSDAEKDGEERKEFKPTAFFEPLLVTDKKGKVSFKFKVPDNLTTFRLTAFGVKDELLALQETEFGTQNPINVQAVQPRRLRVRDTAECGVVLTNLDSAAHTVEVSVQVRKPSAPSDNGDGLIEAVGDAFVDGTSSCKVKVAGGGTAVAYFDVGATETGFVELVYTIKSDILSEKLVSKIQIEKTYMFETTALSGATEKDSSEKLIIPSFAEDGVGSLNVALDASQLGLLKEAVNYVFHYPYGCMEQQSAAVLPLVIFSDYIKPLGLESEVSDTKKVLKTYFKKWKKVQLSDGGFPYWPDGDTSNLYVSLRIAHIYALAMQNGFKPKDFPIDISALKKYIKGNIAKETTLIEAYSCYVFALLGDNQLDGILKALSGRAKHDLMASAYAGLAWLRKGGAASAGADEYYNFIRSYITPSLNSVSITQPAETKKTWYDTYYYASYTAQKAVLLQFFVEHNPKDDMVDGLLKSLLIDQSRSGYWENTSSTSKVLEAVGSLIKERNLEATDFTAKCAIMKKSLMEEKFKGLSADIKSKTEEFSSDFMKELPRDKVLDFNFSKKGKGTLYYTATLRYALPSEIQSARDEGFGVSYEVVDYKTNQVVSPENMIVPLESGTTYKMRVKVSSEYFRTYTAVRVPIPSGCEILDSSFATSGSQAEAQVEGGWFSSMKFYDNEAQIFFDHFDKGVKTVEFTFRAARRGVYPVVPALAECMYEPEIFGRSDGYICTIK
ncbi:MAG: alpha-2-macroglobulin [Treponema sp.]|nr:alpha-2-macroglobulin [Treponema sp.]